MGKLRKLPKRIRFEGRYKVWDVPVEYVSAQVLEDLTEDPTTKGYFDDKMCRILIRNDLDHDEKWWVYTHERVHLDFELFSYMDEESEGE